MRLILVFSALAASLAYGIEPASLTVNGSFSDPIGFYDPQPAFSWKLPDGVKSQSTYQVQVSDTVSKNILWDSDWVESDQSVLVSYGGAPLESRQQVAWRVRFRDEKGAESDWSNTATVEMGLLSNADWSASWIRLEDSGRDAQTPEGLNILKATYGHNRNADLQVNVTDRIRQLIAAGSTAIKVNDALVGDKNSIPDVGKKVLQLKYTIDGIEQAVEINEKQTFAPGDVRLFKPNVLRREFGLEDDVAKARLYVTAKGLYELYLNGERVGKDHFTPGWTPYDERIETLTYDVTDMLHQGPNAIGAMLGEGWYAGDLVRKARRKMYPERKPELLVQLEIFHPNGESEIIVSDQNWKATDDGPIRYSSIYHGEEYDARLEMPGWSRPGYDDSNWSGVAASDVAPQPLLVPKMHLPVQVTKTVSTVNITEPAEGKYVFDLGQNMVGWPLLNIPVQKGKTVQVRFAEMLEQDGNLYTDNYRRARSVNHYIPAANDTITWQPTFTFHGFRYVELSGLPDGVEPEKEWLTGLVLHSDLKQIGHFESSHEKLNRLQQNIEWGQRGNFLDIPTDCPQRDERLGWTGDAQVFCPTAMFNFDVHAFWKAWLRSMREDQLKDGRIPHVIPDIPVGAGSPGWMDAATVIPWEVYVRTGDKSVLAENYDMMERLVGWYRNQAENGIIHKITAFGDWLEPYSKNKRGKTPHSLIATAYYAFSADLLAKSSRVLGKRTKAETYEAEAEAVKSAFTENWFDAAGKLKNAPETQTAYLLALAFDLLPENLKNPAAENLVKQVEAADRHLRTGFLGTPLIAPVLDEIGRPDLALELLFKETYPSWFYSINQGATTMWERWNSYSHEDGFGDASMNSFNHYAYGAIGQWLYERLAGLAPDPEQPGYKHFTVRPLIAPQLDRVRAELETPYGKAVSGWEKKDNKVLFEIIIPPNTTASIQLPDGREAKTISAGTYHLEMEYK